MADDNKPDTETAKPDPDAKPTQRFFELVPAGTNIQFVKNARTFIIFSVLAVLLSIGMMVFNQVQTGSILNFGIDFQGGTSVRLAMSEGSQVGVQEVRDVLEKSGYEGASAVSVPDADNQVLARLKEVTTIDLPKYEKCLEAIKTYPKAKLIEDSFPEGGSKIFLKFDSQPILTELEKLLLQAGCEGQADNGIGKEGEFPIEISLIGVGARLTEQINAAYGANTVDHIVSSETVGAKVGETLKQDGAKSLLYAIGFIFFYVMIRFDLRFAPGGIVALIHDAVLVLGAFALSGKEFTLQTIAALLTVVGYSINDTIVVFDRVRERVALSRETAIDETTNIALNETLSRTILTSGTTMLVVLSIWVLGSGPIKDFAFALFIGVIVGTYSSLFIASPVFLWVNRRFYGGQGHLKGIEEREGTGTLLSGKPRDGEMDYGEAPTGADDEGEGESEPSGGKKRARRRRRQRPAPQADGSAGVSEVEEPEPEPDDDSDEPVEPKRAPMSDLDPADLLDPEIAAKKAAMSIKSEGERKRSRRRRRRSEE